MALNVAETEVLADLILAVQTLAQQIQKVLAVPSDGDVDRSTAR
jgi:hypothetical protein